MYWKEAQLVFQVHVVPSTHSTWWSGVSRAAALLPWQRTSREMEVPLSQSKKGKFVTDRRIRFMFCCSSRASKHTKRENIIEQLGDVYFWGFPPWSKDLKDKHQDADQSITVDLLLLHKVHKENALIKKTFKTTNPGDEAKQKLHTWCLITVQSFMILCLTGLPRCDHPVQRRGQVQRDLHPHHPHAGGGHAQRDLHRVRHAQREAQRLQGQRGLTWTVFSHFKCLRSFFCSLWSPAEKLLWWHFKNHGACKL